jgi:signal transduction histidine kinase
MKRFRLPTKLALAIIPIWLVALVAGAALTWTYLEQAKAEERVSWAGRVAADAVQALLDVSAEQSASMDDAGGTGAGLSATRSRVDAGVAKLREDIKELVPRAAGPGSGIASRIVSDSSTVVSRLEDVRAVDPSAPEASALYDTIDQSLISIVAQSTLYFGTEVRSREGAGAVALTRAAVASSQEERIIAAASADGVFAPTPALQQQLISLETTVSDWLNTAEASSPTVDALNLAKTQLIPQGQAIEPSTFPNGRDDLLVSTSSDILNRVSGSADAAAARARTEALTIGAVVVAALLAAAMAALVMGRSMVRRVRSVTSEARRVAEVDLPKLVDALSDPRGRLTAESSIGIEEQGKDEVGQLASAFTSLHGTLVEVANKQLDILRRGVSDIFVTLARRNRSLVDRQLALIDDLEVREEDPEVLGGYYRLDHLATRMRRNAESLLVLAGAESPRMWADPLDVGEVIRAALGEVDEYQRVDVLAVEPALVAGRAVTDLAHLLSELLDNATQFSPPSERVRVAGLFDDDGYVVTIADNGIGLSQDRMAELNHLMMEPPVMGLALDPTLGMYVVARLANRHGIAVKLVAGVPGTTVRVTIPRSLLQVDMAPEPGLPVPAPVEVVAELDGSESAPIDIGTLEDDLATEESDVPVPVLNGEDKREQVNVAMDSHEPGHAQDESPLPGTEELASDRLGPSAPPVEEGEERASVPEHNADAVVSDETRTAIIPSYAFRGTGRHEERHLDGPEDEETPTPEGKVETVAGLPTRRPGAYFHDEEAAEGTARASHLGAAGIRDALTGFSRGRETALHPSDDPPPGADSDDPELREPRS